MRYACTTLAGSGKRLSQIGLGTWQFGSTEWGYGPAYDGREAAAIVRRALELGITVFDTAEIYGRGRSEQILGAALRDADADPQAIVIASKIFPVLPWEPVVQQRAVASARRLGVREIDLYQVHQPNPVIKDGTTMRGMAALREVGLIGEVGVSNYDLDRWRAADRALAQACTGVPPVVLSNQVQYSLVHRDPEEALVPFARDNGRLILAYSPLTQGLLSGRFTAGTAVTGVRTANKHFLPDNQRAAAALIDTVRDVAATRGVSASMVALAWVIRHPFVVAIPGASSVAQLESNVAAAELELSPSDIATLDAAAASYRPTTGWASASALLKETARRRLRRS
ncbi:MAG: aldo/keto reductase [Austwickia sp.]|jgi:aryl-alcohol dehydrogenase-like predicted oxidoreductase|nr:aldo/keto reductase [Austwickia sp.]MBK8435200.1 aldo/keto reductase [Austwickia sp.]MBK9101246.1 aldo/keto reductase [Austwickia sp.]